MLLPNHVGSTLCVPIAKGVETGKVATFAESGAEPISAPSTENSTLPVKVAGDGGVRVADSEKGLPIVEGSGDAVRVPETTGTLPRFNRTVTELAPLFATRRSGRPSRLTSSAARSPSPVPAV